MKTAGIVAEYNPFHNGHLYQINTLKSLGFDSIVTAMSGNFVQRGEPSVFDKWTRAKWAIQNGVDLVLEIPTCYCLAPAEKFAFGGISALENTKIVDSVCFGSETGDIEKIKKLSTEISQNENIGNILKENLKKGLGYAVSLDLAVFEVFGEEYSSVLKNPNDVLGIEYLNALKKLDSKMSPMALKRKGVLHNDEKQVNNIASAKKIRQMLFDNQDVKDLIPDYKIETPPVSLKNGEKALIYALRKLKLEDFGALSDICEGLESRIYNAVLKVGSIDELYESIKTKRYTLSKIKRLVLNAVLGIYEYKMPPYIRVLGFSQNGEKLLKEIKEKSALPIVTSYNDAKKAGEQAEKYFIYEAEISDFYSICMQNPMPKGIEFSKSIVKI